MSGIPGEFTFEDGMEDVLMEYVAKRLFRIVTVRQPPFMDWNETLGSREKFSDIFIVFKPFIGRYEGFCYEMLLDIAEYLE